MRLAGRIRFGTARVAGSIHAMALLEYHITLGASLNNLKEVCGLRFDFFAFPLKLVPAAGSPVRAVGIIDD